MREKILEIIKNENKKMNPIDIMNKIKKNSSVSELRSLIHELDLMCRDGILRCASGNTFVINDLLSGELDVHEKGNAHLLVKDGNDIFIPRDKMKNAHNKDTVLVEVTDKVKNEGRVVKVLKRAIGNNIAEVMNVNGKLVIVPLKNDNDYIIEFEDTDLNLVEGEYVHIDYVRDLSKGKILARVDRVLGHKNALLNEGQEPTTIAGEIAKIACEFELNLMFPNEVLEEAKKMPKELSESMISDGLNDGREDFRNEIIFTIDGKDTKDIDDAISIKMLPNGNYELGVHIADVSYYVKPGSAIWKEAEKRGNSNYLGNKVLPMLPIELSNGICSLNPNTDRFTTSCIMEIDGTGRVVNSRIVKGIINSKKKMNYDAVEDLIEGKESDETKDYTTLVYTAKEGDTIDSIAFENCLTKEELLSYNPNLSGDICGKEVNVPCKNVIKNAYVLSKLITNFKHGRGEIRFLGDEAKVYQDENDEPYDVKARDQRPAERLIEDFMVCANERVAEYLCECNMPTYRIHDVPLRKKIEDYLKYLELCGIHYNGRINPDNLSSKDCQLLLESLKDENMYKTLNKKLLRSMQKAIYSTENIGHFGIASPCYTHFTSPIRRMDDLLNHTSLGYILEEERMDDRFIKSWNSYLSTMCQHISECERNSEKCEYEVDDMLKARFMENHIGEEFEGTVDSIMNGAFFVQTDNYIDGRVDTILNGEKEKSIAGYYDYDEKLMAYTRNGRVDLRSGDRVKVKCTNSDYLSREIDFALIRKL